MKRAPLLFCFFLASCAAILGSAITPGLRLHAFAPFLALTYHRVSFQRALWIALGCGLLIDLLSSELRFGLHALNYTLTSAFLYRQKKNFFEDQPSALALFSALISATSMLLQLLFTHFSQNPVSMSWKLLLTDLIMMPAADAFYALVWFVGPITLFLHIRRVGLKQWICRPLSFFANLKK